MVFRDTFTIGEDDVLVLLIGDAVLGVGEKFETIRLKGDIDIDSDWKPRSPSDVKS